MTVKITRSNNSCIEISRGNTSMGHIDLAAVYTNATKPSPAYARCLSLISYIFGYVFPSWQVSDLKIRNKAGNVIASYLVKTESLNEFIKSNGPNGSVTDDGVWLGRSITVLAPGESNQSESMVNRIQRMYYNYQVGRGSTGHNANVLSDVVSSQSNSQAKSPVTIPIPAVVEKKPSGEKTAPSSRSGSGSLSSNPSVVSDLTDESEAELAPGVTYSLTGGVYKFGTLEGMSKIITKR
jgi:hypothetical protein